jgi:hypothetical protein
LLNKGDLPEDRDNVQDRILMCDVNEGDLKESIFLLFEFLFALDFDMQKRIPTIVTITTGALICDKTFSVSGINSMFV